MNIVLIGAGNVGSYFISRIIDCNNFSEKIVLQIYSRNINAIKKQVALFDIEVVDKIEEINKSADFYLFMLSDDIISDFVSKMEPTNAVFIHSSGSLPINIFQKKTSNFGALYPFQTFSKNKIPTYYDIPIFIEASNSETYEQIKQLTEILKFNKLTKVDEKTRNTIHIAGIFANNFTNHCVYLAEKILMENNIKKDILLALIEETYEKLKNNDAEHSQTGPALRNNKKIIENHLKLLKNDNEMYDIYNAITNSILKTYHNG